jgi:hypothetical protein
MFDISALKSIFESAGKVKKAFECLKASNLLVKKIDIYDLIEKYFALQAVPKGKTKLTGRLSNYILSNNFPIYTPAHLKGVKQTSIEEYSLHHKAVANKINMELCVKALSIPAISFQPIELSDKSTARLLWLYPLDCEGLVFNAKMGEGLVRDNLCEIFGIGNNHKPIPILVDQDFPNHFLYKNVEIIGSIYTSPIDLLKQFSLDTDTFVLNYYSNFFRPFSGQDGVLAIDSRKQQGYIKQLGNEKKPFRIIYTVQGLIEMPENFPDKHFTNLAVECMDSIPDRQGLGPIRNVGDQHNNTYSIVSIGDTFWQTDKNYSGLAAFQEIDLTDTSYNQAKLAELATNWQVWQKTARKRIREKFGTEPKIRPLICSNPIHEKSFHPNGLQIPKYIEDKLLNEDMEIRKSIDWLGISTGRK